MHALCFIGMFTFVIEEYTLKELFEPALNIIEYFLIFYQNKIKI